MMRTTGRRMAVGVGAALLLLAGTVAGAQQAPPRAGLSQKQEDDLAHKHDGYYGALADRKSVV